MFCRFLQIFYTRHKVIDLYLQLSIVVTFESPYGL